MKRSTRVYLILAAVLLVLGIVLVTVGCVLGAVGDIRDGNNDDAQQTSFSLAPESIQAIQLELASDDIIILPSNDNIMHVSYPSEGNYAHTTEADTVTGQNTLVFYQLPDEGSFLSHFSFNFSRNVDTVTVELPEGYSGSITCSVTSGNISATGVSLGQVEISVSSGDVELTDCMISGSATLSSISGDLELEDCVLSDTLDLSSTSGDIDLESTAVSGDLTAGSISGDISLLLSGSPKHRFGVNTTVSGNIFVSGGDANSPTSISTTTTSGDIYIED
jgi:hypothetical protein